MAKAVKSNPVEGGSAGSLADAAGELQPPLTPMPADAAVRADVAALRLSITSARAAGYVVDLPFPLEALDRIAISETGKVSG